MDLQLAHKLGWIQTGPTWHCVEIPGALVAGSGHYERL